MTQTDDWGARLVAMSPAERAAAQSELIAEMAALARRLRLLQSVGAGAPTRRQVRAEFLQEVLLASGLQGDARWNSRARWITRVDRSKADGFCFEGARIRPGTVEVELGRPRLILVARETGSRAYRLTSYGIVQMDADGTLRPTGLQTDSTSRGWALRLRDKTADLLDEIERGLHQEREGETR